MKWIKRASIALAVLLVAAAVFLVPTLFGKPWLVEHFYLRVLVQAVFDDPLVLTQLRMFEAVGLHFHADDLPDMTMALREEQAARATEDLETLESYADSLEPDERLSYDVMHWLLDLGVRSANRFIEHPYAFDQLGGLHVRFPDVMVNHHLIEASSDARDYIARVQKIGGALDDLLVTTNTLNDEGFTIPRFILVKVEKDARAFASGPVQENPLFTDFEEKVAKLEDASPEEKATLVSELEKALAEQAIPGYLRFADAVAAMIPRAPEDAGVWHLPDGDAYYALCIENNTSTDMTADEIHQIGVAEVERIQKEMRAILDEQRIAYSSTVSIGDVLRKLGSDPAYLYPNTDEGKKQIIARYEEIAREAESKLDVMFQTNPKAPLSIERVPEFKEKTSPFAYYFPAALDGSKPGTFYANLRDTKEHRKWGMRTLVYHEAVPGHHFQLSIARAQDDLPLFRQLIPLNAYAEGWGLYAEQLADEHGFHQEPLDRLGYLDAQLFRAVRLVVDTGLHSKRWTRERAIEYMLDNTGSTATEVETEIERYVVWPGQALGYMVGRLKLLELREKAKQALGERFDLKEFHDVVLLPGALPLSLLEGEVDRWIATKGGA